VSAPAHGSRTAAYLGPPGTFSEEALLVSTALVGGDVVPVPVQTVPDVVMAVQDGEADRGLVPVESASEGSVDATLDALVGRAPDVTVVGEVVLPVRHALIAAPGVALQDVQVVVSHPQALAQCSVFLRTELGSARAVAWTSTAEAVRVAASRAPDGWAAIGTARAAQLYGCDRLRDGIEDIESNATRFFWLAPAGTETLAPPTKTSLAFSGGGAGESGWLVRCLSEFAFRGVNLTRIESRPRKDRLGDYVFFLDLDGGAADERVALAIEGLRAHCDQVRVLGSYPAA
jgi:prephenate dehydratase